MPQLYSMFMKYSTSVVSDDGEIAFEFSKGVGRFPDRPTDSELQAINDFVQKTGRPEEHPDVCLARPDLGMEHVIVRSLDVPLEKRGTDHMAWCSVCGTWKFGEGRLVWCVGDGGLRTFGHDCSARLLGDDRWRAMNDEYTQREAAKDAENYLMTSLLTLDDHAKSLETLELLARQLEDAHKVLFTALPSLANTLQRLDGKLEVTEERKANTPAGFRSGGQSSNFTTVLVGQLVGRKFLQKTFKPSSKIRQAALDLRITKINNETARVVAEDWILEFLIRHSEAELIEQARRVRAAIRKAESVKAFIHDAAKFCTAHNYEAIQRWALHPDSPVSSSFRLTSKGLSVREYGEVGSVLPYLQQTTEGQ